MSSINTKRASVAIPGFHPLLTLRTWLIARRMAKQIGECGGGEAWMQMFMQQAQARGIKVRIIEQGSDL